MKKKTSEKRYYALVRDSRKKNGFVEAVGFTTSEARDAACKAVQHRSYLKLTPCLASDPIVRKQYRQGAKHGLPGFGVDGWTTPNPVKGSATTTLHNVLKTVMANLGSSLTWTGMPSSYNNPQYGVLLDGHAPPSGCRVIAKRARLENYLKKLSAAKPKPRKPIHNPTPEEVRDGSIPREDVDAFRLADLLQLTEKKWFAAAGK
jgi:hypothetical protein